MKYKVGKSKIHGDGVFATQPIAKGEYISDTPDYIDNVNQTIASSFNNHDEKNANLLNVEKGNKRFLIAKRGIEVGEELTTDYNLTPSPPFEDPNDFKDLDERELPLSDAEAQEMINAGFELEELDEETYEKGGSKRKKGYRRIYEEGTGSTEFGRRKEVDVYRPLTRVGKTLVKDITYKTDDSPRVKYTEREVTRRNKDGSVKSYKKIVRKNGKIVDEATTKKIKYDNGGPHHPLPPEYLKSHGEEDEDGNYQMKGFEKAVNQDLDSLLTNGVTDGFDSHWYAGNAGDEYDVTYDQLRAFASENRPKSFVNAAAYAKAMNELAVNAGGKRNINIPFADNPIVLRTSADDIPVKPDYVKPDTLQEQGYIDATGTNAVNQDQSYSTGLAKRYGRNTYDNLLEEQDGGPVVKQRRGVRQNPNGTVSTHLMRAEYIPKRGWVGFPSLFQDSKPYADDQQNWVDMSEEAENYTGEWKDSRVFKEAEKRGEVYDFGEDKEAALAFGEGSWKDQLLKREPKEELYNMKRARELGYERDGSGHLPSVDEETGMFLKSMNHPTAFKEYMYGQLNKDIGTNTRVVVNPEGHFGDKQLQYVEAELTDEEVEKYKAGGYVLEELYEGEDGGGTYTVKSGDTFNAIAYANGISPAELAAANPKISADKLSIGQVLIIPEAAKVEEKAVEEVEVSETPTSLINLYLKQAFAESSFRPDVITGTTKSSKGAQGLAQFMPETIKDMVRLGIVDESFDPYDPAQAAAAQFGYMNWISGRPYLNKGEDFVKNAKFLSGYNLGVGNVKNALTKAKADGIDIYNTLDWLNTNYVPQETIDYVDRITGQDEEFNTRFDKAVSDTTNNYILDLYSGGGNVSWDFKGKSYSGTLIPSMETENNRYARTHNGKIKTLPKRDHGGPHDSSEKKSKEQEFRERWILEQKQNQGIDNTFHIANERPIVYLDGVDPDAEYKAWIDQNIDYGTNPNKSWITSAYEGIMGIPELLTETLPNYIAETAEDAYDQFSKTSFMPSNVEEGLDDIYHLPANLLAKDYSSYSTRDKAFAQARADGETSFMYKGKRFNTRREDDDIKFTFKTDDPNEQKEFQHMAAKAKKDYPILWNLMNKATGIDEIRFDGLDSKNSKYDNRGFFRPGLGLGDGATIGVGEKPFRRGNYDRFINVLVAELAHRTHHVPSNNTLAHIPHGLETLYEYMKYGDSARYQTPGTDEFNNHRLIEPGIHMTVRGQMTPAIVKKVQNFLGVEEDGIFSEDTYLAMIDRFKDNESVKSDLEGYAKENPKDKHPELPIDFGEDGLWVTYLKALSPHIPELSKTSNSWGKYGTLADWVYDSVIPFTKESFKDGKIADFNIKELQAFLASKGYKLPNSIVYQDRNLGVIYYDGIVGDETWEAFDDYRKKLGYKKQGGSVGLGDEVDEATMQRLKKQGYTFEKI